MRKYVYKYKNHTEDGNKVYYRCNLVKYRVQPCKESVHRSDSSLVHMFVAENEHTHENDEKKITEEIKQQISRLLDIKMQPRNILLKINRDNQITIRMSTLRTALARIKKKKYGPARISLGELESWCIEHSHLPEPEEETFVVDYKFINENRMRMKL